MGCCVIWRWASCGLLWGMAGILGVAGVCDSGVLRGCCVIQEGKKERRVGFSQGERKGKEAMNVKYEGIGEISTETSRKH